MNKLLLNRRVSIVSGCRFTFIRYSVCVVLCLILFNQSVSAAAPNSVATIVRATNISTITSANGDTRTGVVRQSIYAGDSIETSEDAWLTLNFFDLTRLILRPNSKLIIRDFPETMSSDNIEFEILTGGVRVTTGTMAAKYPESFSVITPHGKLSGGRSEWVVRICDGDDCEILEQTFSQCRDYQPIEKTDKQFVAAYKGVVNFQQCTVQQELNSGETTVFDFITQSCKVIDEVPCFILFDQKLGQGKIRTFLSKLTPISEDTNSRLPKRPNSRNVRRRPPINRPTRPQRGR